MRPLFFLATGLLLLICINVQAQYKKSFQSRYNVGASLELLGISPLGSGNIEFMAFKRAKSFVNVQLGIGIISLPRDVFSFSQAITYNYWLNQGKNQRRKDCRPERKERRIEYFIEVGVVNFILAGIRPGQQLDYIFPVSGLRLHFPINRKSVIFAKLRYMPLSNYAQQSNFGIALGTSL